jgi:hypothetical protein
VKIRRNSQPEPIIDNKQTTQILVHTVPRSNEGLRYNTWAQRLLDLNSSINNNNNNNDNYNADNDNEHNKN